jgi:mannose-1-phosphate guanylyltransferase
MTLYALIMAGGSGTRLWPRSRTQHPKQFLDLTGSLTMLQEAQARLLPLVPPERLFVATNRDYVGVVADQLPAVPAGNVLGEPEGRGTAAAIGLAAVHLHRRDPEAVMAVLTADHLIKEEEVFRRVLEAAATVAEQDWLVTLGIHPRYPETGYGYIERGRHLPAVGGFDVYQVARFAEKPDLATAEQFVRSGNYAWNSGMFIWKVERILAEMERHMPALHAGLMEIERSLGTADEHAVVARVWSRLPNETIDYGIMEKAEHVAVLPVEIGWNDVGSWAAVYDVLPHDDQGNAIIGQHLSPDTRGSLIYSPKRLIATIGMEDLVVVDTEDVVLISPRSRAQDVKHLVAMLKAEGKSDYLRGIPTPESKPLSGVEVGRLFAAANPVEQVLLSLLLHAGLPPGTIARLAAKDIDLVDGWADTPRGRRPLPDRTVGAISAWLPGHGGRSNALFPQWETPRSLEMAVKEIGRRAGLEVTARILHQTLAHVLFATSEEGQVIRSVLGDEAVLARVPLETQFPFSIDDFTGQEQSELGQRARAVLNRAAAAM